MVGLTISPPFVPGAAGVDADVPRLLEKDLCEVHFGIVGDVLRLIEKDLCEVHVGAAVDIAC
jgi:hypothetical protein